MMPADFSGRTRQVTRRADHNAERQADVLTGFRMRSGKSRTQVAFDLQMEADTYRRYETGQTEMRVNQVMPFARALGTTPRELMAALLPAVTEPWNGPALLAETDMPKEDQQKIWADCVEWPELDQRAWVEGHILRWNLIKRHQRNEASA